MNELTVQFGKRLRELRNQQKLSQEEVAFKAGISSAHLGQIERAEKKPTLETIGKLADALNVSLPVLFSFHTEVPTVPMRDPTLEKISALLEDMSSEEQKDVLRIIRILHKHTSK